jgi:exopolysaccharide biosynthesis polyprenyl glycosylphosphotransferase
VTTIGVLILFFLLFIDSLGWDRDNLDYAKYVTLMYWGVVFVLVTTGRMIVLTLQIYLVKQGRGVHKALIVGVGNMATFIHQNLMRHKLSGMNVIGFISDVDEPPTSVNGVPVIGTVADINRIIREKDVKDVIVAIDETQQDVLIAVLDAIEVPDVSVKIVPNFYQLISGMNQTNQIHGLPLIEVMPDPMPTWEKFTKRTLDVVASLLILLILAPVMLIVAILVKLTSKGPIIFAQNRVGLHGKEFMIYKFRTMVQDAEKVTGPVFAQKQDPRITPLGLILRKLRLDELPQLMNVLSGDMSLVGPRPERPYFVDQFKKEIPLYSRRLRVKPGITGWAQVKWKYDESFEDVVEKTKYDLFYVENISLRMDLKILLNTIVTVITGKGQ